jgi:D-psicose/D-tagatose/L-ribulose 3-epimerase
MRDNIDWAKRIGAGIIVGPVYAEIGRKRFLSAEERKDEWNRAAESLRQLGDYAAKNGVIIALEPLNRFETDMINTAEQAVDMCDQVDSPSVKITLDTFHMNIEDKDMGAAIRASKKHLVHMHTCANDRGVPGEDHIPWQEIREALRDIDYEGYAVIESFQPGQIAAFACIWRDLAPDIEDIPKKGLSFLRNLLTN